jgi:hypothetical protein
MPCTIWYALDSSLRYTALGMTLSSFILLDVLIFSLRSLRSLRCIMEDMRSGYADRQDPGA